LAIDVQAEVDAALASLALEGRRVLLIVPDGTRTAPIGPFFRALHERLTHLDVMIALGTHRPMTEAEICHRLEITLDERQTTFARVAFRNHEWDNPDALVTLGTLSADEIWELSGGIFAQDVPVTVNRAILEYDQLIIVGPVFPHEVVGFSGGTKYLFPGIGGPEILNFFHWLGAVITNALVIGEKWTPVRRVVDRAAAMVPTPCYAFCLVVADHALAGVFHGAPTDAWSRAADLSAQRHITRKPRPFRTVLSCAPAMYDELWVGGKCMYKLEPVVADGGELIIYAPHIHTLSSTHGEAIERIGYHVRDYFVHQWDRFQHEPWGVLAHSTHVRGAGTYENGIETGRIQVTLATGIPEALCRKINLGYRDPATIRIEDYQNREDEGILVVPQAGEILFRLDS
jgi:nickel-dependent lactate racemase